LKTAFSDAKFTINSIVAEDDKVMVYVTMRGINTGPLVAGMAPTNLSLEREAVDIFKFKDGMATEHWAVVENLSMMVQLGIMDMPIAGIAGDSLK
jgi:predicted ester cyclase